MFKLSCCFSFSFSAPAPVTLLPRLQHVLPGDPAAHPRLWRRLRRARDLGQPRERGARLPRAVQVRRHRPRSQQGRGRRRRRRNQERHGADSQADGCVRRDGSILLKQHFDKKLILFTEMALIILS